MANQTTFTKTQQAIYDSLTPGRKAYVTKTIQANKNWTTSKVTNFLKNYTKNNG